MNAEKKLKGKGNALFCVLSLVLLVVLLFPLYWILVTSLKNGAGNLPDSSHAVPQRAEYGFLRGAASKRRFQYVSVLWQQHDHCTELYGDRGHSFRTGLLRPGPVPL